MTTTGLPNTFLNTTDRTIEQKWPGSEGSRAAFEGVRSWGFQHDGLALTEFCPRGFSKCLSTNSAWPILTGRASAPCGLSIFNSYSNNFGACVALQERIVVEIAIGMYPITPSQFAKAEAKGRVYLKELITTSLKAVEIDTPELLSLEIVSRLPAGNGLKTSSSLGVAVPSAVFDAVGIVVDPAELTSLASAAARRSQTSQSGSIDDVFACVHGGVVVTDCSRSDLLARWSAPEDLDVILLIPNEQRPKAHLINRKAVMAPHKRTFDAFLRRLLNASNRAGLFGVMTDAALLTAKSLSYPVRPLLVALKNGASAVSLSGKGPAIGAVTEPRFTERILDAWNEFPGQIIHTRFGNNGLSSGPGQHPLQTLHNADFTLGRNL